jgi:uncharacterized protein (TIGR02231 family)
MKSYVLSTFAIMLFICNLQASEPVDLVSQIREVTVYLQGAQVTRQARINLVKGTATFIFRDLPLNIDARSIQARGEGNFIILSLLHQVNYLSAQQKSAAVKSLQDSLQMFEDRITLITGMQSVMKSEEDLLIANRELGSNEKGVDLAVLKQAADFYRNRLTEIKKEQIRLARENKLAAVQLEKIRNQLNSLNAKMSMPTSEVLVNISANENTSGNLWITYHVKDAGWLPVYDARAGDVQNPVRLYYNARVFQNTGEDWNEVSLKLSTANPRVRGDKPDLQPWFIDFIQPLRELREYNEPVMLKSKAAGVMVEEAAEATHDESEAMAASTAATLTMVQENQTNLEFVIRMPYDIPSDNKQYTINIQENTLPATYVYYCVPKLNTDAFLVARITGWEDYNLLPGEINLFFEGTYVGKSKLDVRNTTDTLDLSLGRDRGIIVNRMRVRDFTAEKTIGSNIRETRTWEITVRNNKKQAVELWIRDQFPVSMNKDIVVEPLEYSGGIYSKESGIVTWKIRLNPSDEKKVRIAYEVKYPKDKQVFLD